MNQAKYVLVAILLLSVTAIAFWLIGSVFNTHQSDFKQEEIIGATPKQEKEIGGKALFYANCGTCHSLDKQIEGPPLRTVETRGPWTDRKNLIAWVKNQKAVIPKFEYTKQLVEAYNGVTCMSFPRLSDKDIEAILDFIKLPPSMTPVAVN